MPSSSNRTLNLLCLAGYLIFMALTFDSSIVDALVFYVTDKDGAPVLKSGNIHIKAVSKKETNKEIVALQFKTASLPKSDGPATIIPGKAIDAHTGDAENSHASHSLLIETPHITASFTAPPPDETASGSEDDEDDTSSGEDDEKPEVASAAKPPAKGNENIIEMSRPKPVLESIAKSPEVPMPPKPGLRNIPSVSIPGDSSEKLSDNAGSGNTLSIVSLIKSLPLRKWEYDRSLDRYVVKYDSKTTIVLTLKPALQKLVERTFENYRCKIGAAVIQDPTTGAILALTSFDGQKALSPENSGFVEDNWALKATFPVASIFKIVTAAAGIEKHKVVPASTIRFGRRATMEFWRAFAKSHNGVFGIVGKAVGQKVLQWYANAFGFNKPFYFDLPVSSSVAELPGQSTYLGQAAAGLNKNFEVSPMHVASIISIVLNRGKLMKPYLVDYVMYGGKVIFRRKPFQLGQPISSYVATQIYEMMKTTTTHGTGKRGFGAFSDCPSLGTICGGKTGTLTGLNPAHLFTWFGGFTKAAGRELGMVVLVGAGGHVKATTIAGKLSHELYIGKTNSLQTIVSRQ